MLQSLNSSVSLNVFDFTIIRTAEIPMHRLAEMDIFRSHACREGSVFFSSLHNAIEIFLSRLPVQEVLLVPEYLSGSILQ